MPIESDLLKNFFESSDAILYLKDEEGRFLMVSRAFGEVFQVDTR
ncbi:MAG: PAS domain S-box protein, partial [Deltaproteobacteria bacterium]|nr:PAS domain S-box protein [Deltaproteobacteria bacterium]